MELEYPTCITLKNADSLDFRQGIWCAIPSDPRNEGRKRWRKANGLNRIRELHTGSERVTHFVARSIEIVFFLDDIKNKKKEENMHQGCGLFWPSKLLSSRVVSNYNLGNQNCWYCTINF